jgi:glycine/D-amino acid oxidase-like deaminating enzyme
MMLKVIVVGAGINGVTAAIELKRRGHKVFLIDPGPLPHPLAASTDISKAIRTAYGADEEYTALAERSIPIWRKWNQELGVELYHETGVLFLRRRLMEPGDFEYESCQVLEKRGHKFERINSAQLRKRFPAFNAERFQDGFFDPDAGYVESGHVVAALAERAKSRGVELRESSKFAALDEGDQRVKGVVLQDRQWSRREPGDIHGRAGKPSEQERASQRIAGDVVVMAVGAWTPYLLPFTRKFLRATGHPVFHLKPRDPELFSPERFPFFGADISTTGYYGFPLNQGVVKIANHGPGREMSPDSSDRAATPAEEKDLREFLSGAIPALADAPIVHTRVCMYCDTHDGHFWIAPDPGRPGLVIATGDCGHGFKFAPMLGELVADAVEGKPNPLLQKFRWRPEVRAGEQKEAARFQGNL